MEMHDDILITYLLGEATAEQRTQVEAWLKTDIANKRRLEQFRLIWQVSKNTSLNPNMNAEASLQRFKQKTSERQESVAKVVSVQRSYVWLKVAATLLLFAAGGWWFWLQRTVALVALTTTRLEVKADTLSDGSVVTLNQSTKLEYPKKFKGGQREVLLSQGEAFFNVVHQVNRPFIINTGKVRVQVLGTSFNIKNKNGRVEVIVETGMVAVSKGRQTVLLKPNEKLSIAQAGNAMVKLRNTNQLYQYYRTREFVADDTPLLQLVNVLNEAYGSHIVIDNPRLNNLPLNTTFKNESLNDILDIISRTFKIKVVKANDTILLK